MDAKKLTKTAVLAAAAIALHAAEAAIPAFVAVPGVKLGLANVVTLVAMYLLGRREALLVLTVRLIVGGLLAGSVTGFLYSAAGGLFCYGVLWALSGALDGNRLWALSVLGAAAHNVGQLAAAVLLLGTTRVLWYLPILLLSGLLTGAFTGLCAQLTLKRLKK